MEETNAFAIILYGPDCELTPQGASSVHVARSQDELDSMLATGWTRYPPGGTPLTLPPFTDPVPDSELVDALGDVMGKRLAELPEEESRPGPLEGDGALEPVNGGWRMTPPEHKAHEAQQKKKGR